MSTYDMQLVLFLVVDAGIFLNLCNSKNFENRCKKLCGLILLLIYKRGD